MRKLLFIFYIFFISISCYEAQYSDSIKFEILNSKIYFGDNLMDNMDSISYFEISGNRIQNTKSMLQARFNNTIKLKFTNLSSTGFYIPITYMWYTPLFVKEDNGIIYKLLADSRLLVDIQNDRKESLNSEYLFSHNRNDWRYESSFYKAFFITRDIRKDEIESNIFYIPPKSSLILYSDVSFPDMATTEDCHFCNEVYQLDKNCTYYISLLYQISEEFYQLNNMLAKIKLNENQRLFYGTLKSNQVEMQYAY